MTTDHAYLLPPLPWPGEPLSHEAGSPFLRAPEGARTIFVVTLLAVCAPLAGGLVLFGWRAAGVTGLSVAGCMITERLYYRVTRIPALLGRAHAALTGVLLALTLPAFVPWYVPVVAAAFAIVVGKAVFGGVGHFVWQPALVGRLAVAVIFSTQVTVASTSLPNRQPVLAHDRLVLGDVRSAAYADDTEAWRSAPARPNTDALLLTPPRRILRGLTHARKPQFSAFVFRPVGRKDAAPAALLQAPPIHNLMYGARPGGTGETSIILIAVAGLYLIYRSYLKWELPLAFVAAAWTTVAIAPVYFLGPERSVQTCWLPLLTPEGFGVAFTYINYQLLCGGLPLAVLLVSAETTSRPVTTGGQVLFGLGCGVLAMVLQLYTDMSIPWAMAVLAMNTLTPTIDRLWRPRVFGTRRLAFLRGPERAC